MNLRELGYVSNLLSLTRVALLLPVFWLLKSGTTQGGYLAVGVMLLMAGTDFLDGALARKLNQRTDLGRVLDPLADKICVGVIGFLLISLRDLPLWYVLFLVARDLAILALGSYLVYRTKKMVESNWPGKVAVTGVAVVMIVFALNLEPVKWPFLWISVALVGVSSVSYLVKFINVIREAE